MNAEGTKLSFQDFIEMVAARVRKFRAAASPIKLNLEWAGAPKRLADMIPDFSETHVFHLGDDEAVREAIKPIRDDLTEECRDRIPTPFRDVSCVSRVPWKGKHYWVLDRLIEAPEGRRLPTNIDDVRAKGLEIKQHFFVMRHMEDDDEDMLGVSTPLMWDVWFMGAAPNAYHIMTLSDVWCQAVLEDKMGPVATRQTFELLSKETTPILEQLAAISHPQNYIVKVLPELSPKEARRVARGEPRPVRKGPHFIVVDHEELTRMSRPAAAGGTHASPVPHERRGHWRRLAERCRLAREGGRDKVFVKPTYVGERSFSDEKNKYEVVFGLDSRPLAAAGR